MKIKWNYGKQDITDAFSLRKKIFVIEQGFSEELEFDDIDNFAYHIVIYADNNDIVGVARLFSQNNIYHVGRVCINKDYRKSGMGSVIMKEIEKKATILGATILELSAQANATHFYMQQGYKQAGDEYLDEHCPHIRMVKTIVSFRSNNS